MACKPRQIIGNEPFAAIPRDYNRYCDRIIGNAGGIFIDPSVLTRAAEIEADGGTVEDIIYWDSFIKWAKNNPIFPFYSDIVAAYSPSWGVKGTTTASKEYSIIGAAQDREQLVGASQPAITAGATNGRTSLVYDGIDDALQGIFTFNRPETVALLGFKHLSWTDLRFIFDGANGNASMGFRQNAVTPDLTMRVGGIDGPVNGDLAINTVGHVSCLFNHPTSNTVKVDGNAAVSLAIADATEAGGLTVGARALLTVNGHLSTSAIICLNSAVDANYAAKMEAIRQFDIAYYGAPA